jgi:membrane-bound lytic murein transglycosylase B
MRLVQSLFFTCSVFFLLVIPGLPAQSAALPTVKMVSPKYGPLLEELAKKGFDVEQLLPLFEEVVIRPEIIDKFERPPEKLSYYEYRKRFLDKGDLIGKGVAYIEQNRALLERVETEWAIPKEVITAILGVETRFGEPGVEKYRVWDVLNTAYILYPRREAFYRDELIAFLTLCKEEELDPLSIRSSYAGAMGVPQFMPSSFLKFAIDDDGDLKRNLWSSRPDIYASVASYFKQAGWKKGGVIRLPAKIAGNPIEAQKLVESGIRETLSVSRATKMGIELPEGVNKEEAVSFISYKPEEGKEVFLALFDNFRVITRYNFSVNYALLVTELSEAFHAAAIPSVPVEEHLLDVAPTLPPSVPAETKQEPPISETGTSTPSTPIVP